MNEKILMIGLDGATWRLLDPWVSQGKLPTFRKLIENGARGILKSTIPCTTSPALPSMLTGVNPGNHGIFSFITNDGSPVNIQKLGYPTIWNILDKYDYCSCIVNVPNTYPPNKLNGVMISGTVPSDRSNYTYPKDLMERVKGFKNDKIEKKMFELRKHKKNRKYREDLLRLLIEQMERRFHIFKKIMQGTNYDFSILWVEETDFIQHCFWEYKEILLKFFQKVDIILNDIFLSFPKHNLFIFSDHGFGSIPKYFFSPNAWLFKQGYLKQMGGPPIHHLINFIQVFAYKNIHPDVLSRILIFLKSNKYHRDSDNNCSLEKLDYLTAIDKKQSIAYLSTLFGISFNPSNYKVNREKIIRELKDLKDEEEERVMRGVWKKEEIYVGKYLKEIPDIIFLTSEKYVPLPVLTKNLFEKIKSRNILPWQSGEHYRERDGILIAHGPLIKARNDLENVFIEDLFPTIMHLMACKIPRHVDGKVLINIFKKNSEPAIRKPLSMKYDYDIKGIRKLEKEEGEKIKKRLRALGYI